MRRLLAITSGDTDGIGLEICVKALLNIGPKKDLAYILFRSSKAKRITKPLSRHFQSVEVSNIASALRELNDGKIELVEVASDNSPAKWVYDAARFCKKKIFAGLVTAPLSKTEIRKAGFNYIGHTEILKKVASARNTFMAFRGSRLSVVLATGHSPVTQVKMTRPLLTSAILASEEFRQSLPKKVGRLPIGIVALNPHAGENGLLGKEEATTYNPVIRQLKKRGLILDGPLVPDVVFAKGRWKKYSVLVASYHDQGLIPFKMLHGFSQPGVHLTLGIPFVRTSVDHGTAKDIFGQNKADPRSMIAAIKLAADLIKGR